MHPVLAKYSRFVHLSAVTRSLTSSAKVPDVSPIFHISCLDVQPSAAATGRKSHSPSWENFDTGNPPVPPSFRPLPSLRDFHLDFARQCSITPCPLPTGQFPFIIPSTIPIQTPRGGIVINQKLPSIWNTEKCDPVPDAYREIQAPTVEQWKIERHAARLIRIRRSKMKKHQYRKLKKRMGRTWAKYKLRRKTRRMKEFYAQQDKIVAKAKAFDPEVYVRSYIAAAKTCQQETEAANQQQRIFARRFKPFGPS